MIAYSIITLCPYYMRLPYENHEVYTVLIHGKNILSIPGMKFKT